LSLPVPAQSEDTASLGDFGNWMVKHIDSWFAFARGLGLGLNRMEDIILVTGRHRAKSWINVAFTQRRPDAGVSFDIEVTSDSQVHLEQQYVHGGALKLGPTGKVWLCTYLTFRRTLGHRRFDMTRTRIYLKINAYLFEDSMSLASWECGQGLGDKEDLLRAQAGMVLNPNRTHGSNS
jgi:hypothetical protein